MFKKLISILFLILFVSSCDSVRKGLTGEKTLSSDEFLVQKKDPLVLPPNYDKLPTPNERRQATEELSVFEKSLEFKIEEETSSSGTVEQSILKKIKSK